MNKQEIRVYLKQLRKNLQFNQVESWSQSIFLKLCELKEYKLARKIGAYAPMFGEVDVLKQLLLEPKKDIYLPVIMKNFTLKFYHCSQTTKLLPNKYQILEPQTDLSLSLPLDKLDLILIPMLGFDAQGHRIGMGQGYYDRYLCSSGSTVKLGLAFSLQECSALPYEPHDIKLDIILTEKEIFRLKDTR